MKALSTLLFILLTLVGVVLGYQNPVPIFGIVTLPCYGEFNRMGCKSSYINAGYVKWIEAAGAKAVAIPYNSSPAAITKLMQGLNGVIFTGGNSDLGNRYLRRTYETIYEFAKKSYDEGVPIPIHGTCLGFEALAMLAVNYNRGILSTYDSSYVSLPVAWEKDAKDAKFFDYLTDAGKEEIMNFLEKEKSTVNIHRYGLHPRTYHAYKGLQEMYKIVGTSVDLRGKPFITMFEGRKYPFFATQYHPERVAVEMIPKENMLQNYQNMRAMHHFAAMLVEKARLSMHFRAFPSEKELYKNLIFNTPVTYTGVRFPGNDVQFYLF